MLKKKLIILWPWYFKKKDWFRYEINYLLKFNNLNIEIHQLGNLIEDKLIKTNTIQNKIIKKFKTINQWFNYTNQESKKKDVFILNNIKAYNLSSYKIKKKLVELKKKKKIKVLEYIGHDTPEIAKINLFLKNKFFILKNTRFLFLINYLKIRFFQYLEARLNYFPNYSLIISKNKFFVNKNSKLFFVHSIDYSNNLNNKKVFSNKKRYAIYIDYPLPKSSDANFLAIHYPFNLKLWFNSLNKFFSTIEKIHNCKILIFPHPKNNLNELKKFYKKKKILNRPIAEYSKNSLFFITRNSTAISYPIIHRKPINLICSKELFLEKNYIDRSYYDLFQKELNLKVKNIDEVNNKNTYKINNVNLTYYKNFEKKYLSSGYNKKTPNYKTIYKIIFNKINNNIF